MGCVTGAVLKKHKNVRVRGARRLTYLQILNRRTLNLSGVRRDHKKVTKGWLASSEWIARRAKTKTRSS